VLSQEALFGAAILADAHRFGIRPHRHELGKVGQAVGGNVLELGGHRRAGFGHPVQRVRVVVGGDEMLVGNAPCRALRVGIKHHHAVAQLMGGNDEEAPELAAAQHAQRGRWQDHGASA
jgi:hypothetical protein